MVKGTDRVASMPELIGRVLAQIHGLAYCPLPFEVPPGRPLHARVRDLEHPGYGCGRTKAGSR